MQIPTGECITMRIVHECVGIRKTQERRTPKSHSTTLRPIYVFHSISLITAFAMQVPGSKQYLHFLEKLLFHAIVRAMIDFDDVCLRSDVDTSAPRLFQLLRDIFNIMHISLFCVSEPMHPSAAMSSSEKIPLLVL